MEAVTLGRQWVRFERRGRGPAVLLVHNAGLDGRLWGPVADVLAAERTVVAIDLPGAGRSDPAGGAPTLDHLAEAVLAVRRATEAVALVGICVGGAAVWRAAQQDPTGLRAIGLLHPATPLTLAGSGILPLLRALQASPTARRRLKALLTSLLARRRGRRLALAALGGEVRDEHRERLRPALDNARNLAFLDGLVETLPGFAALDLQPEVRCPVALAWGGRGRLVRHRPGLRLRPDQEVRWEDLGHLPPVEDPTRVARWILDLSSTPSP